MNNKNTNQFLRENFLLSLLNKVTNEYKALLSQIKRTKPLKIIEILNLSRIPGESKFAIQIANRNCIIKVSAAQIIQDYKLDDFTDFHAQIIQQAALGTLWDFLKRPQIENCKYRIKSKRFNAKMQQYFFTIETNDSEQIICTAAELTLEKDILNNINAQDAYDIGFTQGFETVAIEQKLLNEVKNNRE